MDRASSGRPGRRPLLGRSTSRSWSAPNWSVLRDPSCAISPAGSAGRLCRTRPDHPSPREFAADTRRGRGLPSPT